MKNPSNPRVRSSTSKKPLTYPKGILVLGMHRSGTSAFTRVLNLLGCALPDNLIGAGDGNETGHWEAISVVSLNDQIFTSAGSRWDDWGPLNDDWRQSSLRDEMLQKAVTLIEEHVDLGSLFAIKDPRLCRLADVWLAAMEEAKVEPSVVLMVRNPAEVIASLESRDLMAPGYSQLLWLRHALDAEFFSRGSNRVVCRYDQLMSNWFSVIDRVRIGLGITLPRNSPSVHLEIKQYLNGQHRHHDIPVETVIGNPALSDWLRTTFAIMMRWSEEGEKSSDYAELDQIRLEFDRSYSTFARLLLPDDLAGEPGLGPRMKRELAGQVIAAQAASEEAEGRASAAAAREAELAAEIARLEAVTASANLDVEREAQHRQAIEAQLAEVQQAAQNAQT
ncbi:sulfotransferase family protein, partial [Sphingorhabdus sp.]|uniref:sulfotransferase family protein n=1 Tax=Sphingorhabdus sp. TaxID=1902408 RepID=UPI0037C77D82